MKEEALKVANRLQDVIIYLSEMDNVPTEITDRILQAGLTICLLATSPRELSMEEIEDCMPDGATPDFVPHNKWFKEFANNILKKASGK